MSKQEIVKIMAERIISKGLNPKTNQIYTIKDIANEEYYQAVQEYIENKDKTSTTQ